MKKDDKYSFKSPIKPQEMLAIVGIIGIMVLISIQLRNQRPHKPANPVDLNHLDPRTARMAELLGAQVVPGKSVGKLKLGAPQDTVTALIGAPQLADTAMCKSWMRWEWGAPLYVLEVFASCDPKQNMKKTVQQIRFSGMPFETAKGVFPKSTFTRIQQEYKGLTAIATFTNKETGEPLIIMDQTQQGIAFVVDAKEGQPDPQGNCHTIIIHPPGKKTINTDLQPEWDLHPVK